MCDFYPDRGQAFRLVADFYLEGGLGFRPKLTKFYPDSAEACAKILANFYPDLPQGCQSIIGGPDLLLCFKMNPIKIGGSLGK